MSGHPWLVCGVAGDRLEAEERALLEELQPGGVILFPRNLVSPQQVQELTSELHQLPGNPYVAVDLEGGRVNRLRSLVGALPSPQELAPHGPEAARQLGEVCGALCAALGVDLNWAPVVDVAGAGSYLGGEGRCWGDNPEAVVTLAGAFLAGLEAFGVRGCLKHFPGLGSGEVDSHEQLPQLAETVVTHQEVFHRLAAPHRAVMVAHALAPSLGEGVAPASCSPQVLSWLPPQAGLVVADDVEMGALQGWGTVGERAAAALGAGCHQVLLCHALASRRSVAYYLDLWAEKDGQLARLLQAAAAAVQSFPRPPLARVDWREARERVRDLQSRWEAS